MSARKVLGIRSSAAAALLGAMLAGASCGGGGGGGGGGDDDLDPGVTPDAGASLVEISPEFGIPADGRTPIDIRVQLINRLGRPMKGFPVVVEVSGFGHWAPAPPLTDAEGRTQTKLVSDAGEAKLVRVSVLGQRGPVELGRREVVFLEIPDSARFVTASGSDASSGKSPIAAWRTLDHALSRAAPGQTIHLGAGVHAGPYTIALDSSATTPFVLRGDRDGSLTGQAGDVVLETGSTDAALTLAGARNVVLQGLTLRASGSGLAIAGSSAVRVLDCRAFDNEVGVTITESEDLVVQDCRISNNALDGIRLERSRGTRIENDLVYGNGASGLVLVPPTANIVVRYDTFYRNQGDHVREVAPGGRGTISENILVEGGAMGLALLEGTGYSSTNNLLWSNVVTTRPGARVEPGWGETHIEADPLFVLPAGVDGILGGPDGEDDDFRVLPSSLSIDSGKDLARDVILGSNEALATRSTRSDGLYEWSGKDQALTNLGFHYRVPEPPFVSLKAGGARFLHAVRDDVRAAALAWDRAQPTALTVERTPALNAEVVWVEERVSPLERPEEIAALLVDTGTTGQLSVRHWDGRRWGDPVASPFRTFDRAALDDRPFDLEYESARGRALLAYADGDATPSFRVFENGHWDAERSVPPSALDTGAVRWVEMVPRAASNEIALLTVTDARELSIRVWNGSDWSEPLQLETSTLYRPGFRPCHAAFEGVSGDLIVAWGFSRFAEETRWAERDHASGAWRFGQHPSTDAVGANVVMAADRTRDLVAVILSEGDLDGDVSVSIWDGDTWIDTAELTLLGPVASSLTEVSWIGNMGIAAVVFRRLGNTGSFNVAFYLPHGWRIQPDVVLPGVAKAAEMRLGTFADRPHLLGMVLDEQGKLFGLRYDGSSFSLLNGGIPLAEGLDPTAPGRAFDLAIRRP